MKILIAVDGSDGTDDLVRTAEELFPSGDFVIMSAASTAPFMVTDPLGGGMFTAGTSVETLNASEDLAEDAVRSAQATLGHSADTHVELGAPGPVICEQAAELLVDVVVVGHRAKNWLSRLVDPSVSDYVVRHSPCPVLVVRERHDRETPEFALPARSSRTEPLTRLQPEAAAYP